MEPVQEILLCECGSSEHQVIIRYFEDDIDPMVYVDIHLVKRSFWARVKYALKYIFGYKSRYGAWDEIILNPQHIKGLESVVKYLKDTEAKKAQMKIFNDGRKDS
jgi:hypothetical protein